MLKINERFVSPNLLPQVFSRDQLPWTRSKKYQDLGGLRAQPDGSPGFAQFPAIHF